MDLAMGASSSKRTDNIDIAIAQLQKHYISHNGEVLSLLEMQRWFKNELNRTPSTTTLQKARDQFVEKVHEGKLAHVQVSDPTSVLAQAESLLRAAIQGEADIRIQEAERTSALAVSEANAASLAAEQRAAVLVSDADRRAEAADLARHTAISAYESAQRSAANAFSSAVSILEKKQSDLQDEKLALTTHLTKSESELAAATSRALALASELSTLRESAERLRLEHQSELRTVKSEAIAREKASAAQMSENNRFWAAQVTDLKEQLQEAQKALLASKAEVESAVARARHEAVAGLAAELKRLIELMSGANTLYNTHAGAMRIQVEQLATVVSSLQKQLSMKVVSSESRRAPRLRS